MANGVVKWFNPIKSYGFIKPDEGGRDEFVHVNNLIKSGIQILKDGDKVSYDTAQNKDRSMAINIKLL